MAKVVLKGIDWLELNISFNDSKSRKHFLKDAERFNQMNFKLKTSYLGREWTKVPHKNNHAGRYELVSPEGIYLDFASYENIGSGYLLKIALLKPLNRSLPCLLWESPFVTTNALINLLEKQYGNIEYSIARVDLCCHFTGLSFKASDTNRFRGLPRGPWEHDSAFTGFSFKHKRPKVKRVQASLYNLGHRKNDLPNSFSPVPYYTTSVNLEQVWNLEFKVHKQYLIERKVLTLEQLEECLGSLWKTLTTDKIRMVVKSKDTNKNRWKTNRHWVHIQNAFGKNFTELKRHKLPSKRQIPEAMIKRIETSLVGLAVSLDIWDKSLAERAIEIFGCFDLNKFSDEEMFRYKYNRD